MNCLYCNKETTNPYCLDCEFLETVRNQTLQEVEHYVEEEICLRKALKDVISRRKKAQKEYDRLWDEHMKIFFAKYPLK